jgi:hypothetical protein
MTIVAYDHDDQSILTRRISRRTHLRACAFDSSHLRACAFDSSEVLCVSQSPFIQAWNHGMQSSGRKAFLMANFDYTHGDSKIQ